MLRIVQNSAVAGAKGYYTTADYYSEGQELQGVWRGKGAQRLGLSGIVVKDDWDALCDNRDPGSGKVLTARQKENRRVGYDFNFHVPKSVSLLYGLTNDPRILEAFRASVDETMQDIEAEAETRVRTAGRDEDRKTGNLIWGEFVHTTARPVGGIPDPHLHAHCFVFNATWDGEEARWKAGQFAGIKRDAPFFEAAFHSRLALRMEALGLAVEPTAKGWELAGLSRATLRKFSRRTALIEAKADERGITDPDRKGELGSKTRERKLKELPIAELREEWRSRLSDAEEDALERLSAQIVGKERRGAEPSPEIATPGLDKAAERSDASPEVQATAATRVLSPDALSIDPVEHGPVLPEAPSSAPPDRSGRDAPAAEPPIAAVPDAPRRSPSREGTVRPRTPAEAVSLALGHCFERSAVVPERRLLAEAMRRSLGVASHEAIAHELAHRDLVAATQSGVRLVTTREVLAEEQRMLTFARDGRGACETLGTRPHVFTRDWLNAGQRRAVEHLLTSRDRVMLVRGAAGTGKTSMMREAVEAIEAGGHRVFTFAPSAEASRNVLRQEGFADADTVARFLVDERIQRSARGQVLWIDEAGLLGSRQMTQLFDIAGRLGARVILSGDRRQHGSVERGAVLRLLEEDAGLVPASIKEIQRQKGDYKHAVQALADGRTEAGFRELDRLGWIKELDDLSRNESLARDYVATLADGKSALVVAPTHREGEALTREIREQLRRSGLIGAEEHRLEVLENANLTEAERRDVTSYHAGDVLVFHQNARAFRNGQRVSVGDAEPPLEQAARFQLFHPRTLDVAPGDTLRVTRGGTTLDGKHRLNTGQLLTVKGFDRSGNLELANGWRVAKDFGHLTHGYVVTSHASQGKTVDRLFLAQSGAPSLASSREQFYVSLSRARERATIYTDDKASLLEAVKRSDDRMTASELASLQARRDRALTTRRQEELKPTRYRAGQPARESRELVYER